ncbi:MAG: hypothetical protein AAB417_04110 [Patescibacteria group bacterium]
MEKAPSPSPESSEEPKQQPERPALTKKDQDIDDYNDRLQAFFERNGEKEVAGDIAAERKDQEGPARERGADAELQEHKRSLQELEKDAQENRLTERYKDAGYNRTRANELAEEESERRTTRIRELEDMKAGREKKPEVIELAEDMVIQKPERVRDKYDKTLEDDPRVDTDKLNERYNKTLENDLGAVAEKPATKKERSKDPLADARPGVREYLMAAGMRGAATLAERGVLMLGGKGMELYERFVGYPSLKRERAQKAANDEEQALDANRKEQKKYADDPKRLQILRSEEERLESRIIDARAELGKRENEETNFKNQKRFFENGMRTLASGVLEKIDKRLDPYESQLKVARATIDKADKRLALVNRRLDAYEEKLTEKRNALRREPDPVKRKTLENDIQRLQGIAKSRKPFIKRVIEKKDYAQDELKENEAAARPFRQQQRRFARAAGLEVRDDIIAKGSPPEDLPVMPKGGLRVIEGGNKNKKETKEGSANIDTFIKKWNKEAVLDGRLTWRITDPARFKYLAGESETLTPMRAGHIARKYFEAEAMSKGRTLSPRQYNKAESIGRSIAGKVFPEGNIIKRAIKRVL